MLLAWRSSRKNFNTKLFANEYASGLTLEQIATNHNLEDTWARKMNEEEAICRKQGRDGLLTRTKLGSPRVNF